MDFELLPLELKYKIFSFLTEVELRTKVPDVSENWKNVSLSPYLKKNLAITGGLGCETSPHDLTVFGHSGHDISELFNTYYRVRSVFMSAITHWNWVNDILDHVCLRELKLYSSQFDSKQSLLVFLKKFPQLQSLTLSRVHFINNDCMDLALQCKFLKYIRLKVDHKPCQKQRGAQRSYNCCQCLDFVTENCENLQELQFSSKFCIDDTAMVKFRETRAEKLKKLTLKSAHILNHKNSIFAYHNRLTHLVIPTTEMYYYGVLLVLRNLTDLQSLTIRSWGHMLHKSEFMGLFADITFPCLAEVHFSGCNLLDDEVADAIIESCPALEKLRLIDCDVTMSKAKEIRGKFDAEIVPVIRDFTTVPFRLHDSVYDLLLNVNFP